MIVFSGYEYAEIRKEETETLSVQLKDEMTAVAGTGGGISARVFENGAWGFVSTNDLDTDITALLEKAEKLARLGGGSVKLTKSVRHSDRAVEKIEWADSDEVSTLMRAAEKETKIQKIAAANFFFSARKTRKFFLNSEGSEIEQDGAHFYFGCTAIAKEGGKTVQGSETAAKRFSYKKIDFENVAKTAVENALVQLAATTPPKGRFTVVLDPRMTGTFIHEAVGHAAEADAIITGESIFTEKLGQKVGSELVNIFDDPTLPYFGGYAYDDEGVRAEKTKIIENGVLLSFMNSNETSAELHQRPNGHARAESHDMQPIVRMSNTIFSPGKSSVAELFDIREGVYVKGSAGGSVDIFSGGFMFKARQGYMIKNGEQGAPLRDIVLIGNIMDVLNNVEAVGNDFETHPGICGKHGQLAFVEDGGPHIRVREMTIG